MLKHILGVRSDHSIGESILQIAPMVARVKELGYESVGVTDTMSVSCLPSLAAACKEHGVTPLLGCTLIVASDATYKPPSALERRRGAVERPNFEFRMKAYVRSEVGMQSLMAALSVANTGTQFYYHPRLGLSDVLGLKDVVFTTGDLFNVFTHPGYRDIVAALSAKGKLYVEIAPINSMLFDTLNKRALETARELNLPLLASYPRFYARPDEAGSHDVLRAVVSGGRYQMDSPWLPIPTTRDWSLDEPSALVSRLMRVAPRIGMTRDEIKGSILAIDEVAGAALYRFEKMPISLPDMSPEPFMELAGRCVEGWKKRFAGPVLGDMPDKGLLATVYKRRLAYELSILKKLGFSNYFLLVQQIVNWSKENGIYVGPGRGSAAGSLVSYLLGITELDPIRFGLLFERFINPDRLDLPDVDMDYMTSRRGEVVAHIVEHFGADKVAGISNYSTMGPASSIRDVARVSGLKPFEYSCSKQIEKEHGVSLTLAESAESVADIAKFKAAHPVIWQHATTLEGNMRNLGQHAAGVIVSQEPVAHRAVVMQRNPDALPIVNWDKRAVEDFGLIKMDVLGLSTLDVLAHAIRYIKERHGKDVDLLSIPLTDPKVLKAFGDGDTVGVFQFSGGGIRKLLKDLAVVDPLTFEDIAAATALFRPGPIDAGLMDKYVAVKQGKQLPSYVSPLVEPALKETLGVFIYQEQISRIAVDLCGFTGGEADGLRKAISKKDHVKMAKMRDEFVAGAQKGGMSELDANALWSDIEGFAAYCFNKSHSFAYTLISYQTMWLKVYYPAEFFAASMSVVDDDDKLAPLVIDARAHGIKTLPPDINVSTDRIEIRGESDLVAPFQAVKGISAVVAGKILQARTEHGPFKSFEDFDTAVTESVGGKVNARNRENLRLVGAFASLGDGVPALHPDRLKDRLALMPGFTVDAVKAERDLKNDRATQLQLVEIIGQCRVCDGCSLAGTPHPAPAMGKHPKFMMVFDAPNYQESKSGKMLDSDTGAAVRAALKDAGVDPNDGYYTALVKGTKPKGQKGLTTEQINGCGHFLTREIEILKPGVIVAMGSSAIKRFYPSYKGNASEIIGKTIFDAELDASIVIGFNPATIYFDPGKIKLLEQTCEAIAGIIN